jgi:23S rRNA (cytosine1962-C5)-methyltransferase
VRAAKAGATELVAVDTAARAHARARRNFELSGLDPGKLEQVTADAQKTLERFASRGRLFDLVVCDPPTFSHGTSAGERFEVARDLVSVLGASFAVLETGGFLAVATNSTRLSATELDRAVAEAARTQKCDALVVERAGLPPDFGVAPGFPEGNYLKFLLALKV